MTLAAWARKAAGAAIRQAAPAALAVNRRRVMIGAFGWARSPVTCFADMLTILSLRGPMIPVCNVSVTQIGLNGSSVTVRRGSVSRPARRPEPHDVTGQERDVGRA